MGWCAIDAVSIFYDCPHLLCTCIFSDVQDDIRDNADDGDGDDDEDALLERGSGVPEARESHCMWSLRSICVP